MFVGVCRIVLYLHGNSSLKGKRKVMRSTIERLRSKFHVSVAEVADNDRLQRGVIGVAVIGNESKFLDSVLAKVGGFVEHLGLAQVASFETEVIPLGDELGVAPGDAWEENDEW